MTKKSLTLENYNFKITILRITGKASIFATYVNKINDRLD